MSSEPTSGTAGTAPSRGRLRAFRVLATIMAASGVAFGLFTAVFGIVAESQRIHAFHNLVVATLLLVLSAPAAIAAARTPERSMAPLSHLAVVAVAGALTMALSVTIDPYTLPFVVLVGVLWVVRPTEERPFAAWRPSPILLVLVLAAAVPLLVYALGQARMQRIDTSEHAEFFHWVETSFFAAAMLFLGFLGSLEPTVYRLSARCAGVGQAVLGGGSLLLQDHASAFDTPWAWAALAGGLTFLAVAEWQGRGASRRSHPD